MDLRSLYFYTIVLGFFAGVFAAFKFDFGFNALGVTLLCTISVVVFLFLHAKIRQRSFAHPLLIITFTALSFTLGALRMEVKEASSGSNLSPSINKELTLVGKVQGDVSPTDSTAILEVYAVKEGAEIKKVGKENILLKFPGTAFRYGDMAIVSGVLERPENFEGKDGRVFDYVSYLQKSGVSTTIDHPKVLYQERGKTTLTSILLTFKRWFVSNIEKAVPEPASSLASGVTISGKGDLPSDIKDNFIDAGVIHIVVLSGYNIAIIIGGILLITRPLGRRWSSTFALLSILLFIILAGGAAPVVRAGIMAGIMILGTLSYTSVVQNRALFGAAFIMILWNPLLLSSDASFALSFLATFAMVNVVPRVTPRLRFLSGGKMRQILSETLSTQVFVLPYLLYEIGRLSVIAPISNLVILPLITPIMILCFLIGILGWLPLLMIPVAGALYLLSMIVIKAAELFARLPFAAFNLRISLLAMVLIYAAYFTIYYLVASSKRRPVTS